MIGTCPAGVPAGRIEGASGTLWGSSVSAATVPSPDERALGAAGAWRSRPLTCACPYVFVDGTCLERSWGGSFGNVAAMVAIGADDDGCREIIGAAEGLAEPAECWRGFLSRLEGRGLSGVRLFTGDKAAAMTGAVAEAFPDAAYQRCTARLYRNVLSKVPKPERRQAAAMLKAARAQEPSGAGTKKAESVALALGEMKLKEAARCACDGAAGTPACARFPTGRRRRIRADNAVERMSREIGRRTRVVGTFPDGKSALMPATARLEYVADSRWGSRRRLDVSLLDERSCRSIRGGRSKCARNCTLPPAYNRK